MTALRLGTRLAAALMMGVSLVGAATMPAHAAGTAPVTAAGSRQTGSRQTGSGQTASGQTAPAIPLLAYYYQWFDPQSWDRAKTDYPQLGRYSSDDPRVMRQQIEWAKSAGIQGFIVSWKSTATNNRRLRLLMGVARDADFKLAIIYQGLDFDRHPLSAKRIAEDFVLFRDQFADDPVFLRLGGKPLTIWSGTWAFTHSEVAAATTPVRKKLLVLATERSVDGYQRIADAIDGDAYYWSSVNPVTNTYYGAKLNDLSQAIHSDGKYWIAPLAPGFDARLVGGAKEVVRDDGQTLRTEYSAAVNSSPDLLGLISWNEFSENSYVEPSQKYGARYLDVLRELRETPVAVPESAMDSSEAAGGRAATWYWPNLLLILGFPSALAVVVFVAARKRRRLDQRGTPSSSVEG